MTDLEKSLHEVLHYLSKAADEAKSSSFADVWEDIDDCRTKIGKVLRRIEKYQNGEKPKGVWIGVTGVIGIERYPFRCSRCGGGSYKHSDSCPNCGADMRENVT